MSEGHYIKEAVQRDLSMNNMYEMTQCPCGDIRRNTKDVTFVFLRDEILYDVANSSYVEADIMQDTEEHAKHQIYDIVQEGNVDRVTRVIDTAHSECVEMLYPYTKKEILDDGYLLDDKLQSPERYEITLHVPQKFSDTTIKLLKNLIHEYLVCRVLADWMSITKPGSESKWEKKFSTLRMKIKSCLVSRNGKVRRKLNPF